MKTLTKIAPFGLAASLVVLMSLSSAEPVAGNESHRDAISSRHGGGAAKSGGAHETEIEAGSAEKIWRDLMAGNGNFVRGKLNYKNPGPARKKLTKGQKPQVITLSCSDSRVPPELVFNKTIGELFVIRTAGNVVDPIALGSIEYAVAHLHSPVFVVMGHTSCGAVTAVAHHEHMPTENLEAIKTKIAPALDALAARGLEGDKLISEGVKANVNRSIENILASSPVVREAVESGALTIIPAVYDLDSGKVIRLN